MCVFHVFEIVQMVPNREKHHMWLRLHGVSLMTKTVNLRQARKQTQQFYLLLLDLWRCYVQKRSFSETPDNIWQFRTFSPIFILLNIKCRIKHTWYNVSSHIDVGNKVHSNGLESSVNSAWRFWNIWNRKWVPCTSSTDKS